MKLHRYYIAEKDLDHDLIINDSELLKQWTRVLRYAPGREVSLFNSLKQEAVYKITNISKTEVNLEKINDVEANVPGKEVYLCFSLLKKDKNEWILQKATELGVSHFVPLITERTEKTGWNEERARKIVIEAAEQCGRSDIPEISEPSSIITVIDRLKEKNIEIAVAEHQVVPQTSNLKTQTSKPLALLIGPEGGWSDTEKQLFKDKDIKHISLSTFTLRAETAAITAATLMGEG